ncbi:RING/FYVE/PHD zinc finger superfamily protein [Raphanus sativus]|nr:RING/FYVE/PHD zinc finger superfamily protein [Raphanus sativus]
MNLITDFYLLKEEQLKSSVQHDNHNVENKEVVAENLPSVNENDLSVEAVAVDNENELSHIEKEMIICDACGDQGYEDLIVICSKCKVGAEHTYCMMVKPDVPGEWICHDCTEDKDGVGEGEETSSMERKVESSIDFFKLTEEAESQADLLNRRNRPKIVWLDLNKEPNPDFDEDPNIGLM